MGRRMSLAAWKGTAHDLGAARGHVGLPPWRGQGAGPPSNCCDAAPVEAKLKYGAFFALHPTLHNVGISTVRGLDIAYRCCDPDRHIIGASGHVSGNARRSRVKPAPPFARLGEICPSACGIAVGRIADVLNAPFSWAHRHLRLPFVVALSGCALLGCAHFGQQGSSTTTKPIPLPSSALLTQHPEPGCELKASELNGHKGRTEGVAVRVRKPSRRAFPQIRRVGRPYFCFGHYVATKPDSRPSQSRRELSGAHKVGIRTELLPAS